MGGGREAGTGKKEGGVWREGRRVLQGDSWKFLGRLLEGSEEKCARGEGKKGKESKQPKVNDDWELLGAPGGCLGSSLRALGCSLVLLGCFRVILGSS